MADIVTGKQTPLPEYVAKLDETLDDNSPLDLFHQYGPHLLLGGCSILACYAFKATRPLAWMLGITTTITMITADLLLRRQIDSGFKEVQEMGRQLSQFDRDHLGDLSLIDFGMRNWGTIPLFCVVLWGAQWFHTTRNSALMLALTTSLTTIVAKELLIERESHSSFNHAFFEPLTLAERVERSEADRVGNGVVLHLVRNCWQGVLLCAIPTVALAILRPTRPIAPVFGVTAWTLTLSIRILTLGPVPQSDEVEGNTLTGRCRTFVNSQIGMRRIKRFISRYMWCGAAGMVTWLFFKGFSRLAHFAEFGAIAITTVAAGLQIIQLKRPAKVKQPWEHHLPIPKGVEPELKTLLGDSHLGQSKPARWVVQRQRLRALQSELPNTPVAEAVANILKVQRLSKKQGIILANRLAEARGVA